jgi:hypothetical protein
MAQNRLLYVAILLAAAIVVAIVLYFTHVPSTGH